MKKLLYSSVILLSSAVVLSVTGCSSAKSAKSTSADSPELIYKMSSPDGYSYIHTTTSDQTMDVQGQTVGVSTKTVLGFNTKNSESSSEAVSFDVVLDTAHISVASMMDDVISTPDIKGKSFRMSIKPGGKVISSGDASKITLASEVQGSGDLSTTFGELFPTFSVREATPGQVWNSTDTVKMKTTMVDGVTIVKAVNTHAGYVTLNGRRCSYITSVVEGTRDMKMNSQGMDMLMTLTFKGTESVWFDGVEGIAVKYESSVLGNGDVEVVGMGMSIPLSMNMKTVLELK
ncbi:MAG: hypothetical protein IH591_16365 [Bacteroidales bacterium]|nr:hypothetical protein [Bacteroidales bacterium]